ncbi:MAG: hypothetical protein IKS90_05765 [Clostridia bacterium]|nr:hypothetical protein [Clostridia bacterium]
MIVNSGDAFCFAVKGHELFYSKVFPALFPFVVCVNTLSALKAFDCVGSGIFGTILRFFIACLSGAPAGSILYSQSNDDIYKSVLSALNNPPSPAFIISAVCVGMLGGTGVLPAVLLSVSCYGSALILTILFSLFTRNEIFFSAKEDTRNGAIFPAQRSLVEVFPQAVFDAVKTMLKIEGMVVFFSVFAGMLTEFRLLNALPKGLQASLLGANEMTTGVLRITSLDIAPRLKYALTACCLSFGGICVFMQANAVSRVRALPYLVAKLIQSALSFALCTLLFPLFFRGAAPVMSTTAQRMFTGGANALGIILICATASVFAILGAIFFTGRTRA